MKSQNSKILRIIVGGKVQGVGFRHFAQSQANEHHLRGWVRNLTDGRLETMVSGDDMHLEIFSVRMQQGPMGSIVMDFKSEELRGDLAAGFAILNDGSPE
jgi:acylphosphatase